MDAKRVAIERGVPDVVVRKDERGGGHRSDFGFKSDGLLPVNRALLRRRRVAARCGVY